MKNTKKYEGVFKVEGNVNDEKLSGYAWGEVH